MRLSVHQTTTSLRWLFSPKLESLVAFAIIAYFSGWNYVNTYFDAFGINRSSLSFDQYTIFLYSFFVILEIPGITISGEPRFFLGIGALLGCLVLAAVDSPKVQQPLFSYARKILIAGLGIGCVYFLSCEAGAREASSVKDQKESRKVSVTFTETVESALASLYDPVRGRFLICQLRQAGLNDGLALIWRNSDETVILRYSTTAGADAENALATYRVSNDHIALIESKVMERDDVHPASNIDCQEEAIRLRGGAATQNDYINAKEESSSRLHLSPKDPQV